MNDGVLRRPDHMEKHSLTPSRTSNIVRDQYTVDAVRVVPVVEKSVLVADHAAFDGVVDVEELLIDDAHHFLFIEF